MVLPHVAPVAGSNVVAELESPKSRPGVSLLQAAAFLPWAGRTEVGTLFLWHVSHGLAQGPEGPAWQ